MIRLNRAQIVLAAASALSYAVGYPVALIGGSSIGWLLVSLGGVLLFALGIVTIRRIHRTSEPPAGATGHTPEADSEGK